MNELILENIEKCCNDFQLLLLINKYISQKDYDKFLDKYYETIEAFSKINVDKNTILYKKMDSIINRGYNIIEKRNRSFVSKKLDEYKDYFDNMFVDIDKNIVLDEEQRKAIIVDEDYSLIIAGAGSGKTTTMAAKVKYLVDKCGVKPSEIILLAFTNKAASELENRINVDFKLPVEVLTFHKLGMKFIRKIFNKPVQIVSEATLYNKIVDYLKNYLFEDKEKLREFVSCFSDYLNFDERIYDFKTFNEYYKDYADKKYDLNKENLSTYIFENINNRLKNHRGITGEYYKSRSETLIANYLYTSGYNFTYEKAFPHKLNEGRSYLPDFTIEQNGMVLYIEFYGLTTLNKDSTYSIDDVNLYKKLIDKKRFLHKYFKTDLIELYYKYEDGKDFMEELKKELNLRLFLENKRSEKEIFYKLLYSSQESQFYNFIKLASSFISRFKEKGYNESNFNEMIQKANKEEKNQLRFLKEIYLFYDHEIHKNYQIDFNDMINYAYYGLDRIYRKYDCKYLIIDEYQDISWQRYNLAKKLSDLLNSKIVAVGDDWQAIYGYSGSDIQLFTNFCDLMGYGYISKITNTYRNSQELIDVAGNFVLKNTNQFDKKLYSKKHIKNPIEICYYKVGMPNSKYEALSDIIKKLYEEKSYQKILLLGRYNSDIDSFVESDYFKKGVGNKIVCSACKGADIEFLTAHKSKGLGYDQVIIINARNSKYGFPSQIVDEPLLHFLDDDRIEEIEYPEERRLFYVALTRTKQKVYILVPYLPMSRRSEFVGEILNNENVFENYDYII